MRIVPPKGQLSKYQTNDLFNKIKSIGVPADDFRLDSSPIFHSESKYEWSITWIEHPASRSLYTICRVKDDRFETRAQLLQGISVGELLTKTPVGEGAQRKWKRVLSEFGMWVQYIEIWSEHQEEYTKTTDLWAELLKNGGDEDSSQNTPFTDVEQVQISDQIQEIKRYIAISYHLSSEQMSEVEARLDAADQASRRMGRKDWLLLFNGAIFSLIISELIPPNAGQHILMLALHGLSHLFGVGGLPPHLPPAG